MKYLFINGHFPQYSQTFVHDQIQELKKQSDADLTVFARSRTTLRFENSVPECNEALIYSKPLNAKLILRILISVAKSPLRAFYLWRLKANKKIDTDTLLLSLQLRKEPDISITHFGNNYSIGVQLKKHVFPNMKNIVVFHGHDVSSYVKKNGWHDYQTASKQIDYAITVNTIWENELRNNTCIPNVKTVYLGTDTSLSIRKRNGDNEFYSLIFVGRFVEKKGFELLYQAVRSIRKCNKKLLRVHCIGDGPQFEYFRQKAYNEGEAETFIFYGAKQKSFVRRMMKECDLLVAPSRVANNGDTEGIPVVLMEAMAAEIPIVSSFHSGIPELISNGQTGILVPEGDILQLANAILYAIEHPHHMHCIAKNARNYVSAHHNKDAQLRTFLDTIEEA